MPEHIKLLDPEQQRLRCAERIALIPKLWPKQDPQEIAGFFLDYAVTMPWNLFWDKLPEAPQLSSLEYQRYYLVYLDTLLDHTYIDKLRENSRAMRQS